METEWEVTNVGNDADDVNAACANPYQTTLLEFSSVVQVIVADVCDGDEARFVIVGGVVSGAATENVII